MNPSRKSLHTSRFLVPAAAAVAAAATSLLAAGSAPAAFAAPPAPANTANAAPNSVHVRGTVQSLKGSTLTVSTASGPVRVTLPAKPAVVSVIPSSRAQVKEGSFLGIASVPGANGGAQTAREVVVFPEAARGTGEGSYDWDLPGVGGSSGGGASKMTNGTVKMGRSKMTNGTVSGGAKMSRMTNGTVKKAAGGAATLTLEFKNGTGGGGKSTQTLTLPEGIPFVTFAPGQVSQLTPGAHVVVFGHGGGAGGAAVAADRVLVGKNGLVPPM